jgi:hypothetical protein
LSEKHCERILALCRNELGSDASPQVMAGLCEGLLHFMLTASLLPSQRKLAIRGVEIDVVIPSARMLLHEPRNALVIQVYRTDMDTEKISNTASVQPLIENLWVISAGKEIAGHRNYSPETSTFSRIIVDIDRFVKDKRITGLKLFHGE